MKWIKHDTDAHRDSKLVKVRMKYGLEGYGLYWYLIEEIAAGVERNNITFELEHDSEIIAYNTGIHRERIEEMMLYMVNLGLFEQSSGVITCLKLAKRLDQSMTSNPEMRILINQIRDNHDGVMTQSCKKRIDKTRLEENKKTIGNSVAVTDCPHDEIISLYHEYLPVCPQVRVWTDKRKKMLRARWREDVKRQNMEWWKKYFNFVASCDFLVGKGGGERPFFADLEWLVNPSNMVKVIEGKYQNAQ